MALTVATELVTSLWAVRLTATGAGGVVDWWRSEGSTDVFIGNGTAVIDRGAPLNRPLTYFATDDDEVVVAAPITVPADHPILSSTTRSNAEPVTVISYRPYKGEGRSVWHPILGRSDPYVTIHPALYPAGDLILHCPSNTERSAVIYLLSGGEPLLLRTIDPARLDTMTFLMDTWSDPFPNDSMREGATHLQIGFQRVTDVPSAAQPDPTWTYKALLDSGRTYQRVLDDFGSYQNLADGVPL